MSTAPDVEERGEVRERSGSLLRRVKIRSYKSIKNCDVELGPFTILVGRNGSGKSTFLNALRLIVEGLRDPSEWPSLAVNPWHGRADSVVDLPPVDIALECVLTTKEDAAYEVRLGIRPGGGLTVERESLTIRREDRVASYYQCAEGRVVDASESFLPPATSDRLYLGLASIVPEFRPVFDAISAMGFYHLDPKEMSRSEDTHAGVVLARDGSNLASVWDYLQHVSPAGVDSINSWLPIIVPGFVGVRRKNFGPFSMFVFDRADLDHEVGEPRSFYAHGVSDGTLRVLGILVAIKQLATDGRPIRLVGIEEPETALHPAAAGALMDALREAATHTQILVTTHSADLLDRFDPDEGDHLLLATMSGGATRIAIVDDASRTIIRKHLDTAGGLLRMDQLEPDPNDLERQEVSSRSLDANGAT